MITVRLEPADRPLVFEKMATVRQLLNALSLRRTEVLVIRGRELLTADRRLEQGDDIRIRQVISRG